MVACGTSGLFGGLFIDGVPFNILMTSVPVCALAVVFFAVTFVFLFACLAMILFLFNSFRLVSAHTSGL